MEPIYLVDGSGYIFRAFYAVHPLSSSKGLPTNALHGFARMLLKLLRDVNAKYLAVAFDVGRDTFRSELYPEYKANRAECPKDLVPQLPYFRKIVEAFGLSYFEKAGVEADDIIATLACNLAAEDQPIVIVSGDKDLTQLVCQNVKVWDAMRDVVYDRNKVQEKFGVWPEQIVDYLSLVGDSSDNVPGVAGIGEKTAQLLLNHFWSLDSLLEKKSEISNLPGLRSAQSIRQKIELGEEQLRLSRRLVTLDKNVEPFNQITELDELLWRKIDSTKLNTLCEELEFFSIRDALELTSASRKINGNERYADKNYQIVTPDSFRDFIEKLSQQSEFAFDTETTSLDYLTCALIGLSFCWVPKEAYYLPLLAREEEQRDCLNLSQIREVLAPIFSDPQVRKIGFNLKFDIQVLQAHGIAVQGVNFDGMLCSYVLHPDRRSHGLKDLSLSFLGEEMRSYEEVISSAQNLAEVPLSEVVNYACHDAEASFLLKGKLKPLLGERVDEHGPTMLMVFEDIEMPLIEVLAAVERNGIKVDLELLQSLGENFSKEMEVLQQNVYRLAGKEFNLNSPKQVSQVLFDDLKLPHRGVRKTKIGFSTDAAVLHMLAVDHPIAAQMLEYREVQKLNSTYVESLQRLVHLQTGRVHTSFNQAVTATGRLSSSEPNLQNIPIRTDRGKKLRQVFIADDGCELISADYSQIELRVLAHLSGDHNMQQAFISGEDIHSRTAREIFGEIGGGDDKQARRVAKTINFGIIYGMGASRLADDLGVSRKQAQKYIDDYFSRYPKVQQYFQVLKHTAENTGYVTTMFGRRRYMKDLDTVGRDSGYAGRSMINAPIQGTAAEIMKMAMIRLNKSLAKLKGRAKMVLQVHDELVVECQQDLLEAAKQLIVYEMENAVSLTVPLKVDIRVNRSWGE